MLMNKTLQTALALATIAVAVVVTGHTASGRFPSSDPDLVETTGELDVGLRARAEP
jgi:hypothetical protein